MLLETIFSKIWHFLLGFFLTPLLFWWETDKSSKKFTKMSQSPKILTKKSLVTPEQKMSKKIQKVDPPPKKKKGPFRGLVFEIVRCL